MRKVKLFIKHIEIDERTTEREMRELCPNFFRARMGRRETFHVHRGCMIVRHTRTYSDGVSRRETAAYLFTKDLEGAPDFFCLETVGNDMEKARKIIDHVLAWGDIQVRDQGRFLGKMRNEWRRRVVEVYEHSTNPDRVITIGRPFDGGEAVICNEKRSDWEPAIEKMRDASSRNEVYVYK